MPRQRITAENIESAEHALAVTYQLIAGQQAHERVLIRAGVDPEAYEMFAKRHKSQLFKDYLPDIDPRLEPAIMTMLLHFFAVGTVSQRFADGRPS